ncbi:MAG: terpene cyclase/mutase family protein [Planctomycetes bacterium]|nr:terpene cyclase/mutase family protein [Planctomycetota bacterium]
MSNWRVRIIQASFGLLVIAAVALKAAAPTVVLSADRDETSGAKFVGQKTETAIASGLAYLAANQHDDGSFGSGDYRVAVTALSGMAFLAAGYTPGRGKYGKVVSSALQYILSRVQSNGYIRDGKRRPMYGHGFATLFLAETYGMTGSKTVRRNLREKLKRAVVLIETTQKPFEVNLNGEMKTAGGWRYNPESKETDISVTVCQVMALRAARNCGIAVSKTIIDRSAVYVKFCQNRDGGFRYQTTLQSQSQSIFPRSAAALVALYSAGIYKGREIDAGLKYLKQFRPGGKPRQETHYFYGHYYAVQAMWHAGGRYWKSWYPAIRDELLAEQKANGRWKDSISDAYGTAMACLILQTPMNYLPIFQR